MDAEKEKELDYKKWHDMGLYTRVRIDPFDSKSERRICVILNHILQDYDLETVMQIRLLPEQTLDNYLWIGESDSDDPFRGYFLNKNKWMKFDFLFVQVYEHKEQMHYIPVAVVEFDGPDHQKEKQRQLDAYKDGVAENIGAGMVRIPYETVPGLDEALVRSKYEDPILKAIITGYFTESKNFRKEGKLIGQAQEGRFQFLRKAYTERAEKSPDKADFYRKMLGLLEEAKEKWTKSGN